MIVRKVIMTCLISCHTCDTLSVLVESNFGLVLLFTFRFGAVNYETCMLYMLSFRSLARSHDWLFCLLGARPTNIQLAMEETERLPDARKMSIRLGR